MAEDNEKAKDREINDPSPKEEKEEKDRSDQISEAQKAIKEMLGEDPISKTEKPPKKIQAALLKQELPEDVYHTIKFMEDVPVQLYAEVARTETPLRNILSWKSGSIVRFDKVIGEPVDILIGEQLLARGEVVVVNNRFGIRISEITRPDEKVGNTRQ